MRSELDAHCQEKVWDIVLDRKFEAHTNRLYFTAIASTFPKGGLKIQIAVRSRGTFLHQSGGEEHERTIQN